MTLPCLTFEYSLLAGILNFGAYSCIVSTLIALRTLCCEEAKTIKMLMKKEMLSQVQLLQILAVSVLATYLTQPYNSVEPKPLVKLFPQLTPTETLRNNMIVIILSF